MFWFWEPPFYAVLRRIAGELVHVNRDLSGLSAQRYCKRTVSLSDVLVAPKLPGGTLPRSTTACTGHVVIRTG